MVSTLSGIWRPARSLKPTVRKLCAEPFQARSAEVRETSKSAFAAYSEAEGATCPCRLKPYHAAKNITREIRAMA